MISTLLRGAIREVWLDRPAKRNALDAQMRRLLIESLAPPFSADERVVLLRARGTVFCAGLDLNERRTTLRDGGPSPIEEVIAAIRECPLPVVAVLQGDAIAGGCELALACDLVVASTNAGFVMPLAPLGTVPNVRLVGTLTAILGVPTARRMLFLGERISADQLESSMLPARVVSPDLLDAAVDEIAGVLASLGPLALRAIKGTINQILEAIVPSNLAEAERLIIRAQQSADAQEGILARLERRTPSFDGH